MSVRLGSRHWLAIAGALLLWASAFAGIRAGMRLSPSGAAGPGGYGPGELALLRFGTASLALAGYAAAKRMRLPALADLPRIAIAGFLGISVYHAALNFGEVTVQSAAASLLIAAGPVFTALLSAAFLGERLTRLGWAGIFVAFAGVILIALSSGDGLRFTPGALLILLSAAVAAVYSILSKKSFPRHTALEFTAYSIWAGTLPLLVFLPGLVRQLPAARPSATAAVVYLGCFPGALAYLLWNDALSRMPAALLSSFLYLSPVLASAIAWAWLGEVPSPLTVLGGAIAIAGVVLVQTRGRVRA
ncbi:DMT family transporter [Geothrix sp. 21YS21S-4]|uniref:DMT family transporter n=1 Tax=Geothrix sp. 21YS21S-4 TaxID=3068889 RepID=UPI0027BAE4D9|nr:DMT family transporter [Geothrix sp. 21YS21S-4]